MKRLDEAPEYVSATETRIEALVIANTADLLDHETRITTLETTTTIENRTDDPVTPAVGRMWLRTDL